MGKLIVISLVIGVVVVWGVGNIQADTYDIVQFEISTASGDQVKPDISGDNVVWVDATEGQLHVKNLATNIEFTIATSRTHRNYSPDIDGDRIVWTDTRNVYSDIQFNDIYGYNLSTGTEFPVSTGPWGQGSNVIDGDIVLWTDQRNGNWNVWGYDLSLSTEFPVTQGNEGQRHPIGANGNVAVFLYQFDQPENSSTYGYNLSTGEIFLIGTNRYPCDISGNTVVLQNYADESLYGYELNTQTEFRITAAVGMPHGSSRINKEGNFIVWQDNRNGNWDVFGYDLSTETEFPIATGLGDQIAPSISGNTVVWEMDGDIYGARINEIVPQQITLITPNGGEILATNSTYTITWAASGSIQNVLLELSSDNGENWENIDTVENSGSYEWTVPAVVSDECLIRITDGDNIQANDASNSVFSIKEHEWYSYNGHQYALTLGHSNWVDAEAEAVSVGGHLVTVNDEAERDWLVDPSLPFGSSYTIGAPGSPGYNAVWVGLEYNEGDIHSQESWQWVNGEPITFWEVQPAFYSYEGIHMTMTGTYHPIGAGQFVNGPHHDSNPGAWLRGVIEIISLMISSPNGGEILVTDSTYTITWESSEFVQNIILEFSSDNGENWEIINTVENTGSYEWTVPPINSEGCLIRVSDSLNASINDTSDAVFTIFECDPPIPGDVNGDCYVNLADVAIIALNWLRCGNPFDPLCGDDPRFVGHWNFNEQEGDTAYDSSGYENDGILINGPVWTGDGALNFDGIDDYVEVPDSGSLKFSNEITVSVWVYLNAFGTDWPKVVIKPHSEYADPWEMFTIDLSHDGTYPRFIVTDGVVGGASSRAYDDTHTLSLNQWYNIVGTYNGSTIALYVDGQLVASEPADIVIGQNDMSINIAGRLGINSFNGLIDEVRIYSRALSESEIQDLYQDDLGWIDLAKLVSFDEHTTDLYYWRERGDGYEFSAGKPRAYVSLPYDLNGSYELMARLNIERSKETVRFTLPVDDLYIRFDIKGDSGNSEAETATMFLTGLSPTPIIWEDRKIIIGQEYEYLFDIVVDEAFCLIQILVDNELLYSWEGSLLDINDTIRPLYANPSWIELETAYYTMGYFAELKARNK